VGTVSVWERRYPLLFYWALKIAGQAILEGCSEKRRILLVGIHTIIYGAGELGNRMAASGWIRQVLAHDCQNVGAVSSKNDSGIMLGARQLAGLVFTDDAGG
jgi:hypothetical protein